MLHVPASKLPRFPVKGSNCPHQVCQVIPNLSSPPIEQDRQTHTGREDTQALAPASRHFLCQASKGEPARVGFQASDVTQPDPEQELNMLWSERELGSSPHTSLKRWRT